MKQLFKLSFLLLALLMPATALAYDFEVDGIYYNKSGTNAYVTYRNYSNGTYVSDYSGEVTIPSTVAYGGTTYSVTYISDYAFYNCSGLTSVTIPNSVTYIGNYAFYNCNGLTSVNIPNSVTYIGNYAFYNCSGLTSVNIPNSVTGIGSYAFYYCRGLTSVNIPNSVTYISNYAFYNCSGLTSVTIPNSVTSIGSYAFQNCSSMTSVTIGNSVTSIGDNAFRYCNAITDYTWNSRNCSYNGNMPTSNIERVSIGNEVKILPNSFVNGSKITSINIPNSVTSIGNSAFRYCSGLTSINIPNSVSSIGSSAFQGCSSMAVITVESGNSTFDSRNNCNAIIETSSNTLIVGCKNTIIPNSVTSIGNNAFYYCSGLTSVNIPNSVTSIGNYAFYYCSGLTSVIIPNSITTIYEGTFQGCSQLTSVIIPNSVITIGNYAFYGCSGLKSVNIPNSVTSISDYAFSGCSGLTSVNIPISVTSIGSSAFYGCSGLTSVNIPNSVTSIGSYAFSSCSALTSVNIPNTVTSLGDYAFSDCYNLNCVTIGNSVTSIGSYAFYDCYNLRNMTFKAINCTTVAYRAFYYTNSLTNLQFGDSVQHIPAGLPNFSMSGKTLIIPNSVKTIDAGAINGSCAAVVIGKGLENIAASTFSWNISVAYATTAEPLPCEPGAFSNPQTLYVPAGSKMKYFTAPGWSEFTNIIEGEYTPATAIELDKDNVSLYRDASLQLSATILPDTASAITNANAIGWYSLNSNVASISNNGMITANGVGETDIIVWVDQVSDTCHVKVTPIMVENITLSANHLSMALNETYTLTANVAPNNAENRTLEWIIPDNDVLLTQQVTPTSLNIGAAGEGTVTITVRATDGSGMSATCEVFVSVNTPVKSLTLTPTAMNLYVGNSQQINATITPQDAYTQDLRWTSSNTNVATVNSSGLVNARGVGTAVITAMTTDGSNLSATCTVTVTNIPVESVTLNTSELELYEGNYYYLSATVLPNNAYNKSLTWASSNPRVATVTSNGRVNALEVGSTVITATTTDGTNISAACRVTVKSQTATNCFVMPDTTVLHGESITIPVRMNNNQSFMAFQTDVYLPTGFSLATDEDDEYIITMSNRLTSDHVIMTSRMGDGAIRVICYTPNSQPISGNQGDLFYITVKVPEDAAGDYAINLRNSLLTTTNYQERTIPDAGAVLMVNTFIPGDANDSRTVTVTDIVVTAQYILQKDPHPFIFEAADMNGDGNVTVTDIMLIAYLINHPTMNAPKRMPAMTDGLDRMSGESVTLNVGETRTVSIKLDNDRDYSAFQLDLTLPEGLTASNFCLTDRAGSHTLDVNTLADGKTRALCYSPAITPINGNEGAVLTFDVTATCKVDGSILVDGIELVTTDCQTVILDDFAIAVNSTTAVNETVTGKAIAKVEYYNLAGQRLDHPESGVTLVVTTYTDGTRTTTKVFK